MYRELTPADHRRVLGIDDWQVPDVLLLVGVFAVHEGVERFTRYLERTEHLPHFPAYLGTSHGLKVGLAAACGGPMAAMFAHTFCGAGTPAVVQLGWFGALQEGMALGDVLVPRHAERGDGTSDWYLSKGILADATPELNRALCERLTSHGIPVGEHSIYTTPALFAESREIIADWSRHGYQGVDMETAATFAVAKSLGAARAAALLRLDDLIAEEDGLADTLPSERRHILRAREAEVVEAVLEAVASYKTRSVAVELG